jgi:oligopeptide/dipeptide ABC transporter ATP-binding protein
VTEPLLDVRGLAMHFPLRRNVGAWLRREDAEVLRAVDGVDLQVGRGEMLGLVGESGCGKSTLGRCIVGLYEPTAGEIRYEGELLAVDRARPQRRRIQMVFQDPYSSLNPRMTVRQTLAELLRAHAMVPRHLVDARCRELLDLVGLGARALDAHPRQFSGGQRQRVSIARALALEPELLVADEPVSALDVSVQATVLNLLEELRQKLGLAVLLIAHNMAVVRHVCDRVAVMYLGRIVETAATKELFTSPRHPYTQGLLRAVPRLRPGRTSEGAGVAGDPPSPVDLPTGCRFHPRCPVAQEPPCASEEPELASGAGADGHLAACHFAWRDPPTPRTPEPSGLERAPASETPSGQPGRPAGPV